MVANRYLKSERLYLRKITKEDSSHLFALHSDKSVMKYMAPLELPPTHIDQIHNLISNFNNKYGNIPGAGFWAVILKDGETFVGWIFIKPFKEDRVNDLEIGYRLFPQYWNKGYCTEISTSLIKNTFAGGFTDRLVATVNPKNKASIRVLMKIGFKYTKMVTYQDYSMLFYTLPTPKKLSS